MRISDWGSDVCSSDLFVAGVNAALGLRAPEEFPSEGNIASSGAFGICGVLASAIPANSGIQVLSTGVEVNIKDNTLPHAPNVKVSMGVQYTPHVGNGMALVPRLAISITGQNYANIIHDRIN